MGVLVVILKAVGFQSVLVNKEATSNTIHSRPFAHIFYNLKESCSSIQVSRKLVCSFILEE